MGQFVDSLMRTNRMVRWRGQHARKCSVKRCVKGRVKEKRLAFDLKRIVFGIPGTSSRR